MEFIPYKIDLPDYALVALHVLEGAGFEAWCVGGCVRDALCGRAVHDIDLATNATWRDVENAFSHAGMNTHETGVAQGTLTVIVAGHAVEVTTYRTEGAYSDARHPDAVSFVGTIEEDLARRDFTMNALAYHPDRGLADPYGGIADISQRLIRAVGNPLERFAEDALRILRACRFVSQLGFSIDPETMHAMLVHKTKMLALSRERVSRELDLLLLGDHVYEALMSTHNVLVAVLPELVAMAGFEQRNPYHIYDVLEHTAHVVQNAGPKRLTRWAALFHDSGKPASYFAEGERGHFYGHAKISVLLAREVLERLGLPASFIDDVLTLVLIHDDVVNPTRASVKRALVALNGDVELFRCLCDLKRADALSQAPRCAPRADAADKLISIVDAIVAEDEAFSVNQLAIDGNDVMDLGVERGPVVGEALSVALAAVIDEDVENKREPLIEFVKTWLTAR